MNPSWFPNLGDPRIIASLTAPRGFSQLCHALRRLWTPRHPPCTLCSLTTLFLYCAVLPRSSNYTFVLKELDSPRGGVVFLLSTASGLGQSDPRALAGSGLRAGGGDRIRTDDRLVANQVLYQLSYAPWVEHPTLDAQAEGSAPPGRVLRSHPEWWACVDLNHGPPAYQADALTN